MLGTCFWDASGVLRQLREVGFGGVRYVEGWAVLDDGTVLEHAWAECEGGVIDISDQNGRRVVEHFGAFWTDEPSREAHDRGISGDVPLCRDHLCVEGGSHFDAQVAERYKAAQDCARKLSGKLHPTTAEPISAGRA